MASSKPSTSAIDMVDDLANAVPGDPLDGQFADVLKGTELAAETQARQYRQLTTDTASLESVQSAFSQKIGHEEATEKTVEAQGLLSLLCRYATGPTNTLFDELKKHFPSGGVVWIKAIEEYLEKHTGNKNTNSKILASGVLGMGKFNDLEQQAANTHAILEIGNRDVGSLGHSGVANIADYLRFVDNKIQESEESMTGLVLDHKLDANPEGITKADFDKLEAIVETIETQAKFSFEGKESDGDVFLPVFSKKEISEFKNAANELISYWKLLVDSLDEIAEEDGDTETDSEELQNSQPSKKPRIE